MTCKNLVDQYVPRGWDYVNRPVQCGRTMRDGSEALCDECRNDPRRLADYERRQRNADADNAWARSAGYGEY